MNGCDTSSVSGWSLSMLFSNDLVDGMNPFESLEFGVGRHVQYTLARDDVELECTTIRHLLGTLEFRECIAALAFSSLL